jgi:hypothetical protein
MREINQTFCCSCAHAQVDKEEIHMGLTPRPVIETWLCTAYDNMVDPVTGEWRHRECKYINFGNCPEFERKEGRMTEGSIAGKQELCCSCKFMVPPVDESGVELEDYEWGTCHGMPPVPRVWPLVRSVVMLDDRACSLYVRRESLEDE